ncbi:MAG TPA: UDP-N-acetylglucosamine 2-epimerase, partial [Nitrososphaerales archaeon]|nr:UDP-N-acetylglucosamine 2-epimerase [Nitrososphaerales archaeon]
TIVDAVKQNMKYAHGADIGRLERLGKDYLLATVHRQENVDDPRRFKGVAEGLARTAKRTGLPVVYPAHPRSLKMMRKLGIKFNPGLVKVVPPATYLQFLRLEDSARLILTDSGGVQEEACVLGVPCVTLRDNTERPETIHVGANVLAGTEPGRIVRESMGMIKKRGGWKNPFGDGKAAERIVNAWTALN